MSIHIPLPLDGHNPSPDRVVEDMASRSNAVGREATPVEGETLHPDYLRLFGPTRPDRAIIPVDPKPLGIDAALGPPPPHQRDPDQGAAGHFLFSANHPSAASLASVAALRLRHIANGHSPETDAAHGPVFFMAAARAWWQRAQGARTAEARRKAIVAAAAIFVAMIDAHDFTTQQPQEPTP